MEAWQAGEEAWRAGGEAWQAGEEAWRAGEEAWHVDGECSVTTLDLNREVGRIDIKPEALFLDVSAVCHDPKTGA